MSAQLQFREALAQQADGSERALEGAEEDGLAEAAVDHMAAFRAAVAGGGGEAGAA